LPISPAGAHDRAGTAFEVAEKAKELGLKWQNGRPATEADTMKRNTGANFFG
jgi:hypothetical protein